MASGNALDRFFPADYEQTTSNYATFATRNQHPVLQFDTTTQEAAIWSGVIPPHYTASASVKVRIHYSLASATSGTVGWDVAFERIGSGSQDTDADGFASAQTVTAVTVPGTSGNVAVSEVTLTNAQADAIAAGELYRVRVRRDVANDTATGDAEIHAVEIIEA